MPAPVEITDGQVELDSRLPADERAGGSARRATWPPWPWLEARGPDGWSPIVVDLVGGCAPESRVGPVAVVPGTIELQTLLEGDETVRDRYESPRALGLERPDAALDHGEAAILADGAEPLPDTAATAPASELPGDELPALVGDEIPGLMTHLPEEPLQEPANDR